MLRSALIALAALALTLSVGLATLPGAQIGDANGDGTTTAVDAALILQFAAGLTDSLPA